MTGVEIYLTALSLGTLLVAAFSWLQSFQMRKAAMEDLVTVNKLARDLIELDRARSQRVTLLHELVQEDAKKLRYIEVEGLQFQLKAEQRLANLLKAVSSLEAKQRGQQ
jgi:hypothetical protein